MFSMREAQMSIPHLFKCPISLDLLADPVTLSTGQTYDRSNIQKWLAAGNLTCPVTMIRLHDSSLVPNHTLRHLIEQWLQMGCQVDHLFLNKIDSLAALEHNLESHEATLESKFQTLEKILVLCDEMPSRNSCMLQLGFVPLLLKLVFGKLEINLSQENVKFVEKALTCVIKLLPFGEVESLNMLKEEHHFTPFLNLFKHGTVLIRMSLCHLIEAISSCLDTKELYVMLGQTYEILHWMVLIVDQDSEASEAAIKGISSLCTSASCQENLVNAGAVDGLITYVVKAERRKSSMAARAMETLEQLLGVERAKKDVINNPNGISVIIKMIFRVSDHGGSDSAVGCLIVLCCDSLRTREDAINAGVLTKLLLLLQSQCNGRTKTKARMLLKLLRSHI